MAVDMSMPVLVVDDYNTMIRIIRNLLKQLGFEDIDDAADGSAALTKMREKRYGLVISDWNMEPMTGYELLKEVRSDPGLSRTPFIMVTAESKTENVIAAMKVEIGALRFKELRDFRIPAAGQELDAIVKAAEVASNTIMECAEAVMAVDAGDPAAYKTFIEDRMMLIFEACAFQDITGQRVAKVVETLQHIEVRVSRFAEAVRTKDLAGYLTEDERVREERKQTLLLHGPQLEGEGIEQSEVDGLMAPGRPQKK